MTHICKIPWGSEEVATLQIKVGGGSGYKKMCKLFWDRPKQMSSKLMLDIHVLTKGQISVSDDNYRLKSKIPASRNQHLLHRKWKMIEHILPVK